MDHPSLETGPAHGWACRGQRITSRRSDDIEQAAVYVKARCAVKLDAVCESLPLEQIAPRIVHLVASTGRNA